MTDSSTFTTQNAVPLLNTSLPPSSAPHLPPSQPPPPPSPAAATAATAAAAAAAAIFANGHPPQDDGGDAEEGAIKCICTNPDDDGSTVMCDKCETWQHIICYYAERNVFNEDAPHFCVDCLPRHIDAKAANERQRAAGALLLDDPAPRRSKPSSKTKKKGKSDSISYTNGHVDGIGASVGAGVGVGNGHGHGHGSPRNGPEKDTPKPRRPRHQSSASISNLSTKAANSASKRASNSHHAVQSPMKSPHTPPALGDPSKAYSFEFMHLYKNDTGEDRMAVSQFEDLHVPMSLGDWVRNPEALAEVTSGKTHDEIFIRKGPLSAMRPVPWIKHRKEDRSVVVHGRTPMWIYITAEKDVSKDTFVGELIGKIGFMQDYTQEPVNRWEYLRHPLPFVFFHPQLPIVIDTREEGSIYRYLRRSCQPNLAMKTFLDEVRDYHFCFTASREIEAGTELTIPWTLDEHVRRFFVKANEADVDEDYVSTYTRKLMAEFGGCACNDPSTCVMASWAGWTNGQSKQQAKSRKKSQQRGVGSRSSSEAVKHPDEDEMEDATAASTSSRSKPQSRDNTPSSLVDAKPISEREKRKIEALERSEQRQPERKKTKRRSNDGRNGHPAPPPTPGLPKRNSLPEKEVEPSAAEAGFRAGLKASPSPLQSTPMAAPPPPPPPPPAPKPTYSEASCQVDLDCTSLSQTLPSPTRAFTKRPMSSLHRRVFRRSVLKSETESPKVSPIVSPETERTDALHEHGGTQSEPPQEITERSAKDGDGDTQMEEAGLGIKGVRFDKQPEARESPTREEGGNDGETKVVTTPVITEMKPPPTPQTVSPVARSGEKPEIQIDVEPPATSLPDQDVAAAPAAVSTAGNSPTLTAAEKSPSEASAPILAPHLSREADAAANPSPATKKKKINLSQYLARRNSSHVSNSDNDAEGGRDNLSAKGSEDALRSLSPLREEARENGSDAGGSGALETPKTENGDPMVTT